MADASDEFEITSACLATTLTIPVARRLELARLIATIVIAAAVLAAGAVKTPSFEIDPADADQLTEEFAVPVTVAVNFCSSLGPSDAACGEIEI